MTVKPIPQGFRSVLPLLYVKNAPAAIEFYHQVFGARPLPTCLTLPDGKIAHAEIEIGDTIVMIADENPDWGNRGPHTLGGASMALHLYLEDVDATVERALAAGAKLQIPVSDQFYGDRTGRIEDPFGHVWIVATHVEDVAPQEMQHRFEAWLQQNS